MENVNKYKWLYEYHMTRTVDKEVTETSEDKDGKEVKITTKVPEEQGVSFKLRKPNRKLYDAAELFYGVKMSEGIKAGLLTRSLLSKRYEDDGGAFSESEKKRYSDLYMAIYNKESEYQRLQLNLDNKPSDLKEKLATALLGEIGELRRELQEIENAQANIFDQTAENRAKNQVIMWWVLHLAYWKEHDHQDFSAFFEGDDYDARLENYDVAEDSDDDFFAEAIRKLAYFISFWYMGRAGTEEDFKAIEGVYDSQNKTEEEVAKETEEEATEETKAEKTTKKKPAKKKTVAKKPKKKAPAKKVVKKTETVEEVVEELAEETVEETVEAVEEVGTEVVASATVLSEE